MEALLGRAVLGGAQNLCTRVKHSSFSKPGPKLAMSERIQLTLGVSIELRRVPEVFVSLDLWFNTCIEVLPKSPSDVSARSDFFRRASGDVSDCGVLL